VTAGAGARIPARKLAAVLGIQYRIVARTNTVGEIDPAFVAKVKETLARSEAPGPQPTGL